MKWDRKKAERYEKLTVPAMYAALVLIIYILITICPTLAATVRRWHDLGRTGKWLWLNLVPGVGTVVTLGFMCCKGEDATNEYGRNPRERKIRRRR